MNAGELEIDAPIGRVEAPVAHAHLVLVRVAHEVLGRVQLVTRVALDTRGVRARIQLGVHATERLAEALVHHFDERRRLFAACARRRCCGGLCGVGKQERWHLLAEMRVEQVGAQALGIGLGEEAAVGRANGQQVALLEYVELLGARLQARDLQALTGAVDLLHAEVVEHRVEYVVEAEATLAAHHEARDALRVEQRLHQVARARVRLHALQIARSTRHARASRHAAATCLCRRRLLLLLLLLLLLWHRWWRRSELWLLLLQFLC